VTRPHRTRTRLRLRVERVVAGGDGLAREPLDPAVGDAGGPARRAPSGGRVVFVPGALPGELVDVELVGAARDFARSRLVGVVEPSPARVTPPCEALHRGCGGCDWQHVDARTQLELKVEVVREALRRTARLPDAPVRAGGSVAPWDYRTSMRFALGADGVPSLHRHRSDDLVPLAGCPIAHPSLDDLVGQLRLPGADEVSVRVSAATGERSTWWRPEHVAGLVVPGDVRTGRGGWVTEHVAGVALRVSSPSFFQSGPGAAELLVATVRSVCGDELAGATHLVDLYGGVGLFASTLLPAGSGATVTVVEGSPDACADARVNLADRGADVVESSVERWAPERADVVVADPARQGLGRDAAAVVAATGAPVVALVSCDPVSLARDAAALREHGYVLSTSVVLDLFPQTHHVEAVTRFDLERAPRGTGTTG